ncbi:MAG: molecular chaperone HtpG [Alphaproteobacteria bacterium]|nr:molecular chaperone HtpG [Alphaproteobacteria bacterium]
MVTETRRFDAEVGKVLQLMIHSLYTNKDIFLRELVSNASDACDKLRYQSQTKPELLGDNPELKVIVSVDKDNKTVSIADSGIGMSHDDLVENLGTIARSGTQAFMEQLSQGGDVQLIGQFGVGFYSAFIVADEVTVISRKAGEDKGWVWKSDGKDGFTIEEATGTVERGTTILLKIRESESEYLDAFRLKHIITTYSDHITLPVSWKDNDGNVEVVNSGAALWSKPKSDITEEQYTSFYRHVSHAVDEPWLTLHNKNEGKIEFTNLLFVPKRRPFDLFHPDRKCRVKLYVKKVFITEEGVDLIPAYLRFVKGVVDSQDLPLNISRETLQHNNMIQAIKRTVTKKILNELNSKAQSDTEAFNQFWQHFGPVLKEGLCEGGDTEIRELILKTCRFYSTKSLDKLISLEEYIGRMKEGQKTIYYHLGENKDTLASSPQLEGFNKNDIEVLLFTDHVDDFWVSVVHDYQDKAFKSVTRAGIDTEEIGNETQQDDDDDYEIAQNEKHKHKKEEAKDPLWVEFVDFLKAALVGRAGDVRVSKKLVDSPVCLVVPEGGMDMRIERYLVDQQQLPGMTARILEINTGHPMVQWIDEQRKQGNTEAATDLAKLLFDQACINEGEQVANPTEFSKRLNHYLMKALSA